MVGLGTTMSELSYDELKNEVEFLRHYRERSLDSFGPADSDIDFMIKLEWLRTGRELPEQYKDEE